MRQLDVDYAFMCMPSSDVTSCSESLGMESPGLKSSLTFSVVLVRDPASPCLNNMDILIQHRIVMRTVRCGSSKNNHYL